MLNKTLTPFPILKTQRLTLRRLMTGDEQAIFTLRSDAEVNRFLNRKMADSIDDAKLFIKTVNENIDKNTAVYWAITFSDSRDLVGTICLFGFSGEHDKCEIGYELLPNFQGKGIMHEAALSVIDHAFNTIGMGETEAVFHRDNAASVKLLEKLAFEHSNVPDKTAPELLFYHLKKSGYTQWRSTLY